MGEFSGQQVDLYDHEVAKIEQQINPELQRRFATMSPTRDNIDEMVKWATQAFFDIGLVIQVDIAEAYLGIGSPTIQVVSRVNGHSDDKYGHDHERHRDEVLKANELGEKYRGQKFKDKGAG